MIPFIIESGARGERSYDIYSRLLKDRIVMLNGPIDDVTSNSIIAQLLFLDSESSDPIFIYINSPGGSVSSGMAIYDTMKYIKTPVHTICIGQAASMAAVLLTAGDKRYILPSAEVMIHQPMGGVEGQTTDIVIQAKRMERIKANMIRLLIKHTNMNEATVNHNVERDTWFTAEDAIKYGLVDKILESKP